MDQPTKDLLIEAAKTLVLPAIGAYGAHWWHTRTKSNLDGLQVFPSPSSSKVMPDDPARVTADFKPEKLPSIRFDFKNTTGEVVFIHRCRLTNVTPRFRAHNRAFFDVGEQAYELKFQRPGSRDYILKEIILQTGETAKTIIPLESEWDGNIPKKHSRSMLPPFRKQPSLFCIRYEATAGDKTYNIKTLF
jgi:hypothetical protein